MKQETIEGSSLESIGYRLALSRQALQLKQNEFAHGAGISPTTYNEFENARTQIGVTKARALRKEYGLTLDWIYEGDPSNLNVQLWQAIKALRAAEAIPRPTKTTKPKGGKGQKKSPPNVIHLRG